MEEAEDMFKERYETPVKNIKPGPAAIVCLQNLDRDGNCQQLIEDTHAVIKKPVLERLFMRVQDNNLELKMRYVVACEVKDLPTMPVQNFKDVELRIIRQVLAWYPRMDRVR